MVGDTIEEINARLQQARSHAREVVRSESSSAFAATDPPQFIQNNFKLFGYVVYAAVTKFRRTFFSRCALYDAGTKSVDFILMRVLSTCCDNPNRAWYVYHIKTETFKIVDGRLSLIALICLNDGLKQTRLCTRICTLIPISVTMICGLRYNFSIGVTAMADRFT